MRAAWLSIGLMACASDRALHEGSTEDGAPATPVDASVERRDLARPAVPSEGGVPGDVQVSRDAAALDAGAHRDADGERLLDFGARRDAAAQMMDARTRDAGLVAHVDAVVRPDAVPALAPDAASPVDVLTPPLPQDVSQNVSLDARRLDATAADARAQDARALDAGADLSLVDEPRDATADTGLVADAAVPPLCPPAQRPPRNNSVLVSDACTIRGGFLEPPGFLSRTFDPQRMGYSLEVADLDGDGDLDVMDTQAARLHENLGDRFDLPKQLPHYSGVLVATADVDGDGRADWLTHLGNGAPAPGLYWRRNPGQGRFAPAQPLWLGTISDPRAADADGDGDVDVFLLRDWTRLELLLNQGGGRFEVQDVPEFPAGVEKRVFDATDLNGDGCAELLLGTGETNDLSVAWNRGDATFDPRVLPPVLLGDMPPDGGRFVDVDGDGLLDLTFSSPWGHGFSRNLGDQTFADPPTLFDLFLGQEGRFIDIDGDDDLDYVQDVAYHPVSVWENVGQGRFRRPVETDITTDWALVDMDCDELPDLCTHASSGALVVQRNLGAMRFEPADRPSDLPPLRLLPGDFDGDGDTDLLSTWPPSPGDLSFVQWQVAPGEFQMEWLAPLDIDGATAVQANGDALTDLFVRMEEGVWGFAHNLGRGVFAPPVAALRGVASFELADVDGDGQVDVTVVQDRHAVWHRQGEPDIPRPLGDARIAPINAASLLLADLGGDGVVDLVAPVPNEQGESVLYVMRGLGGGAFESVEEGLPVGAGRAARGMVDLDGDGALDLLGSGPGTFWFRRAPGGEFTRIPLASVATVTARGDLDGDGDPDLILTEADQHLLALNRGDATFETPWPVPNDQIDDLDGDGNHDLFDEGTWITGPLSTDWPRAVPLGELPAGGPLAVADLDGDGRDDVAVADETGRITLALGDNAGGLVRTVEVVVGVAAVGALRLADVNGDGFVDVLARSGDDSGWWLFAGDGQGAVAAGQPLAGDLPAAEMQFGDLDADGSPELVLCQAGAALRRMNLAAGEPVITDLPIALPAGSTGGCALIDHDRDGDLDLTTTADGAYELWDNDGRGGFTLAPAAPPCASAVEIAAADVNLDGWDDVVCRKERRQDWFYNPGAAGGAWQRDGLSKPSRSWLVDLEAGGAPERVDFDDGAFTFKRWAPGWGREAGLLHRRLRDPTSLAFTDLNADGRVDVLISEPGQPGLLRLLQQPLCAVGRRSDDTTVP